MECLLAVQLHCLSVISFICLPFIFCFFLGGGGADMDSLVKYPSCSLRHHALPFSPLPLLHQQLPCKVNSGAIKGTLPQASGSGAFHNADGFFSVSSWLPLHRNHLFPAHHRCLNAAKHQKQENDGVKAWSLLFA